MSTRSVDVFPVSAGVRPQPESSSAVATSGSTAQAVLVFMIVSFTGAVLAVPIAAVGWAIIKTWDAPDPTLDERRPLRRRRRVVKTDATGSTPVA